MATSLVTGAAGFIGSHLVHRLLARGERVIAVDNLARGRLENLKQHRGNPALVWVEADVADEHGFSSKMEAACGTSSVDCIWHLAANSDVAAGEGDLKLDLRATFLSTVNVIDLAKRRCVPALYFTSSSAVFGELGGQLREDSGPLLPVSNYGAMKLASEAVIAAATASFLKRAIIFRLPNVVGARSTHGLLHDLFCKMKAGDDPLMVLGDGSQCKPYMHVSELLVAMDFVVAQAPLAQSVECYHMGPQDSGIEVCAIVDIARKAFGSQAQVQYGGGDRGWPGDVPRYAYSAEKLMRKGWITKSSSVQAVELACREMTLEAKAEGWV